MVLYKFFKTSITNKNIMMANSKVSEKVKRSALTNEVLRRLICHSPNLDDATRTKVLEKYAKTLKRSGYQERIRHVKISDALKSHTKN